jgi:transcriptional regulator with XRE-family HTH domain
VTEIFRNDEAFCDPDQSSPPGKVSSINRTNASTERRRLLGEIVAYRRKALGFTQEDIAAEINCSVSTICFLETARCKDYRIYFLQSLALVLKVDPLIFICIILNNLDEKRLDEIYRILDRDAKTLTTSAKNI